MECLKCGKETEFDHCFCNECMEQMEKYPVKPGTPVQLPQPSARTSPAKERPKKKAASEADQLAKLYHRNQILVVLLLLLVTLCLFVSGLYVRACYRTPTRPTGQNYSTTQELTP